MKSEKTLYTSADVKKAIVDLFENSKGRRVAITAFVGSCAEEYLPYSDGIELVCWPKAGGTNPNAIRTLVKRGVKVSFVESLHMKIYWTEDKGAVITSANLSTNALGTGNLYEFGILVPSNKIDINRVLKQLNPDDDIEEQLHKLDKAHELYRINNKWNSNNSGGRTYLKWYSEPMRRNWKVGCCGEEGDFSKNSIKIAKDKYSTEPRSCISCLGKTYSEGDWILTFFVEKEKPTFLDWLYVDFIAKTGRKDDEYDSDNPYQAVQAVSDKINSPPFKIDKQFKKALTAAINEFGVKKFINSPPIKSDKLIESLRKNYK
jgi:hypothetical protein